MAKAQRKCISSFEGVCRVGKFDPQWVAQLDINGKIIPIGFFAEEVDAAAAYDKAAVMLRGKGAKLNFPLVNYLDSDGKIIVDPEIKAMLKRKG